MNLNLFFTASLNVNSVRLTVSTKKTEFIEVKPCPAPAGLVPEWAASKYITSCRKHRTLNFYFNAQKCELYIKLAKTRA